jgi:hypothetical protein|nr:MAG TPA: hypothetical protein [Caudoviricetes sp.]
MKNVDLFDLSKNYIYEGEIVTLVDELAGYVEENGEEVIILPSQTECLGDKVEEFKTEKQYVFCKELIPKHLDIPLSGWENEINRKPVEVVNKKNGYCFNDKNEGYVVFASWCMEV